MQPSLLDINHGFDTRECGIQSDAQLWLQLIEDGLVEEELCHRPSVRTTHPVLATNPQVQQIPDRRDLILHRSSVSTGKRPHQQRVAVPVDTSWRDHLQRDQPTQLLVIASKCGIPGDVRAMKMNRNRELELWTLVRTHRHQDHTMHQPAGRMAKDLQLEAGPEAALPLTRRS